MSRFDQLYRSILLTKFFTKGWGDPEKLKRIFSFRKILSEREKCQHLVASDYPVHIDKELINGDVRILSGHFKSPLTQYLPDVMPQEVQTAKFEAIFPTKWSGSLKPVCIHLAGTGDHGFWRRRVLMARPLLKETGIASILLENPYYGVRKPKQQLRSSLHNVSDLFVMGGALVLECLALFHWCEREGLGPLGITGISMGGFMASLAATNWHKPISLVPCLSWSTASSVFTQGVMSGSIPWKLLQEQYSTDTVYQAEIAQLMVSPEMNHRNKAFQLGKKFMKDHPQSMDDIDKFQEDLIREDAISSDPNILPNQINSSQTNTKDSQPSKPALAHYHTLSGTAPHQLPSTQYVAKSELSSVTEHKNEQSQQKKRILSSVRLPWKSSAIKVSDRKSRTVQPQITQQEALDFMRGAMDECTHLGNFSLPVDPSLVIIVAAKHDAYVPRDSVVSLQELWPGSEVRYINAGHIASFLLHMDVFRKAIKDTFDLQIQKYPHPA